MVGGGVQLEGVLELGLSKHGCLQSLVAMLRNMLKCMQVVKEMLDVTQKLTKAVQVPCKEWHTTQGDTAFASRVSSQEQLFDINHSPEQRQLFLHTGRYSRRPFA